MPTVEFLTTPGAALALLVFGVAVSPADIVTLRDGTRYYGEIVHDSEREVAMRVHQADGATALRVWPRDVIRDAELNGIVKDPRASTPANSEPVPDFGEDALQQMLRECWELLDDGEEAAALRALQRIVARASRDGLAQLDQQHRQARGAALDEQMAELRLRRAIATSPPGGLKIRHATPFESAALGRRLAALQETLVAREYGGASVQWWADNPSAYAELRADARRMVDDATLAAGAISARLRLDPSIRAPREEAGALIAQRDALGRFAAKVRALRGFSALRTADKLNGADPTLAEAQRIEERLREEKVADLEADADHGDTSPPSTESAAGDPETTP